MHQLDNAVWHALTGPQHTVAERVGAAARYDPTISPFAALPDEPDADAWRDLAALVGAGGVATLFRTEIPDVPREWTDVSRLPGVQMVATRDVEHGPAPGVVRLGDADSPDMLSLVAVTKPGPFTDRTHELGAYLGLREDGVLVAMAGERMRLAGHTEVSAVCTAPTHQRRGLGATLVRAVIDGIVAARRRPLPPCSDRQPLGDPPLRTAGLRAAHARGGGGAAGARVTPSRRDLSSPRWHCSAPRRR